MKTITVILAFTIASAIGASVAVKQHGLYKHFDDIKALFPKDKIAEIIEAYYQHDPEVKAIFQYMKSDEFLSAAIIALDQPEINDFRYWVLINSGLIPAFLRIQSGFPSSITKEMVSLNPGWKGFVQACFSVIPIEEIRTLIKQKIEEDEIFAEFWHRLQDFKVVYERIITIPQVALVLQKLAALGVDLHQIDQFVRNTLNWN